ncbi:unnamed protein product [Laminaria digitata]
MKLTLRWSVAVCVALCNRVVLWTCSAETRFSAEAMPSEITKEATCDDWASWVPPRTDPAVVMQVVSEDYVDLEKNFIRLMELNSVLTRQHMFLMCLDDASLTIFASLGIRCVPVGALRFRSHKDLWKIRVRTVSCLVTAGYNIIMSDSDALWLGDPMEYMTLPAVRGASVIASRGGFPHDLGGEWGSTICMGFVMFRATGAGMNTFQDTMGRIVLETGDDQVSVNRAAQELGIAWDKGSDMRYMESTSFGKGTIANLSSDDGEPFDIALLPHSKFTRICRRTPVSNDTMVAHCIQKHNAYAKLGWMQQLNLWAPDGIISP